MTSKRLFIAVVGLICAYFATILGDGAHVFMMSSEANPSLKGAVGVPSFVIGVLSLIFGAIITMDLLDRIDHCDAPALSVGLIACPSALFYTFGLISGPIAAGGYLPWSWFNTWTFIAILGLIPPIIVFWDAVSSKTHG